MAGTRASAGRIKLLVVVAVLLGSGLALLAWTQTWISTTIFSHSGGAQQLEIDGATAAPALTALALAGLALGGALTIAGPIIRHILGALEVLLGVSVGIAAYGAVSDPTTASSAAVTAATGVAGKNAGDGVVSTSLTIWPYLALVAAVIMVAAGIAVLVTSSRWPGPTSRFQTARLEPVAGSDGMGDARADEATTGDAAGSTAGAESTPGSASGARPDTKIDPSTSSGDSVGDWDDLSRGEDPTR
ncbi:hypothetical protein GCM10022381_08020 [Leifsonia kafniensis]|uniref:Trp biosynthesis-associated membrane protein n=1 Tax=Leifsonia kafniensis TaxID=475957 RepID=A0ABP7K814_9MICO